MLVVYVWVSTLLLSLVIVNWVIAIPTSEPRILETSVNDRPGFV